MLQFLHILLHTIFIAKDTQHQTSHSSLEFSNTGQVLFTDRHFVQTRLSFYAKMITSVFSFQTTTAIPFVRHYILSDKYFIKKCSIRKYFSYFCSFMEKDIICSETVLPFKSQFLTFQLWPSRRHCWTRNPLSGDRWTGLNLLLTFNSPTGLAIWLDYIFLTWKRF